jgi:thiol-disulfide isomerase/thioredoxin
MSRSTQALVLMLTLAVGAVVGVLAAGGDAPGGDLEAQIKALNERVAGLEKEITALKKNLPPGQAQEQAASAALQEINSLLRAGNTDQAKTDLKAFMAEYGNTNVGKQAQRLVQELSVVGKDSPADWGIAKWFQGESDINLAGDGTTMVVFWETWCPHCAREVPKLEKLYADYRGKGLQVIGVTKVTRSSTDDKVSEFLTERSVTYPVAKENGELSRYFAVAGIPAAAVVKDGKIVWRGHPAQLTNQMLEGWL